MGNKTSLQWTFSALATRAFVVLVSTGEEMELLEIEDMLVVGGIVVKEDCLPSLKTLDQDSGTQGSRFLFRNLEMPSDVVPATLAWKSESTS